MKSKAASFFTLALTLGFFVLGPALLVLFVDPFQVYHRSFFKNAGYGSNQGYQHAGWINTVLTDSKESYRSVVLGSSVAANYDQSLFDKVLPQWGKVMNLSFNGGTPKMQAAVAQAILEKTKNIKHILWDVHYFYGLDSDVGSTPSFPFFLYNKSIFDDFPYFFNATNLASSINFIVGNRSEFSYGIKDNGPWYDGNVASGRFSYFGNIKTRKDMQKDLSFEVVLAQKSKDAYARFSYPNVDSYMLADLMPLCNFDVKVDVVFSPANRYLYASQKDLNFIYRLIYMRRYVMEKLLNCKNIRVFAFDNVDWITTNLANYMDNFHFDKKINEYILESIATDKHRVNSSNIDMYEKNFIAAINAYPQLFMSQLEAMEQNPKETALPVGGAASSSPLQ